MKTGFLFLLLIGLQSNYAEGRDLNNTNAVLMSFLLCGGNYVCQEERSILSYFDWKNENTSDINVCPTCECATECLFHGNCCPGIFFSFSEFNYLQTSVIQNVDPADESTEAVLTVSTCPAASDPALTRLCEKSYSKEELLLNLPVTSDITNLTYRNVYCAKCHGENIVKNWTWGVSCPNGGHDLRKFNFLSEISQILEAANTARCRVELMTSGNRIYQQKVHASDETVVSECNITGTWQIYDRDVERACRSAYEYKYGDFKNIYCYMCNPPVPEKGEDIDVCNETSLWTSDDSLIEAACLNFPGLQGIGRYKNIFCYICNSPDVLFNRNDILSTVSSSFEFPAFQYTMRIHDFTDKTINDVVYKDYPDLRLVFHWISSTSNSYKFETKTEITRDNVVYNATYILQTLFAFKDITLCNNEHIPARFRKYLGKSKCSCEPSCIFVDKCNCCPDVSLTYPTGCLSDKVLSQNKENETLYLVTNGCYGKDLKTSADRDLENLCVHGNDTLSKLPVSDSKSHIQYKNIFCYLCNTDFDVVPLKGIDVPSTYMPWVVHLSCDKNLDFTFTTSALDKIELGERLGCDITLEPPGFAKTCEESLYQQFPQHNLHIIDQCNGTGFWTPGDEDIKWACEGLLRDNMKSSVPYKNEFCGICNTEVPPDVHMPDKCTWILPIQTPDLDLEAACSLFPNVYFFGKVKNRFCYECIYGESAPMIHSYGIECECTRDSCSNRVVGGEPPMFRDVFRSSVVTHILPKQRDESSGVRVYDYVHEQYKDIKCYPGKRLTDFGCRSTLTTARYMKYVLKIVLQGGIKESLGSAAQDFLQSILDNIDGLLRQKLYDFKITSANVFVHGSCSQLESLTNGNVDVIAQLTLYFPFEITRDEIEMILLDIHEGNVNMSMAQGERVFTIVPATVAEHMLTADIHELTGEVCSRRMFEEHLMPLVQDLRASVVNKLLFCEQLVFSQDVCHISYQTSELVCSSLKYKTSVGNFLMYDNEVRVCLDDIKDFIVKPISKEVKVLLELGYLTNVCIIISVVSLFITFITYVFFKKLRTTPGILIMSLVFSIFVSQITFTYGASQIFLGTYCVLIGIVSHYFWLAMFACTNACSFHMFSSFKAINAGKLGDVMDSKSGILLYFAYSYGTPILFVVGSIVVTYVTSDDLGYGNGICFLSHTLARVFAMIVPACLACVINAFLFLKTICFIHSLPDLNSTRPQRNNFVIFVKLFTITGTLWTLQIIDSFIADITALTYITSVLNGLQGLYIFIGYVCNKNVLGSYLSVCRRRVSKPSLESRTSDMSTKITSSSLNKGKS